MKSGDQRYDDDGYPHGVWRRFDAGGRLIGEIVYEHGIRTPPAPPCPPDPGDCPEPWWPTEPVLPPLELELPRELAARCPPSTGREEKGSAGLPLYLHEQRDGVLVRWCTLDHDGSLSDEGERRPDGSSWSVSWISFLARLGHRYDQTADGVARRQQFDYECLCKTEEWVRSGEGGEETFTVWQPTGLLAARGPSRSEGRVRLGRWTFWAPTAASRTGSTTRTASRSSAPGTERVASAGLHRARR